MEILHGAIKMLHFFYMVCEPDTPIDFSGPATSSWGIALCKAMAVPPLGLIKLMNKCHPLSPKGDSLLQTTLWTLGGFTSEQSLPEH